jgi:TRAP-type transport system small permease protein
MHTLKTIDRLLGRALHAAGSACLMLLLVIVAVMVLNRFAGIASLGWTDEIVELLFAWMIFIGAAAVWRERGHFCVDALLVGVTSPMKRSVLALMIAVANLAFLGALAYLSLRLTLDASETSPVFAISKAYWYGVMPAMLTVMCAYCIRDIVAAVLTLIPGKFNEYRPVCN